MTDIVVTGIGLMTPLGLSRESTWTALIAGKTGICGGEKGLEACVQGFSPNGAR